MMDVYSVCRRKYLWVLIAMTMTVGMMGYLISSSSQSLTWLYPSVVMDAHEVREEVIPSKLRLLSYKGMTFNQNETILVNNQSSSFNNSSKIQQGLAV